jgi:SPP1 family predicted phage head-tail adaptor
VRAGALNRRINVDEPIATQNETGEEELTFSEVGTVWGMIQPGKGKEPQIAGQVIARLTSLATIRWTPNVDRITAKWRLRHKDTVYNVIDVDHIDLAHREIQLTCDAGVNLG